MLANQLLEKWPHISILMCEPDQTLIEKQQIVLKIDSVKKAITEGKFTIINENYIEFIEKIIQKKERFDKIFIDSVILCSSLEKSGEYFNEEFYNKIVKIMKPNGTLCQLIRDEIYYEKIAEIYQKVGLSKCAFSTIKDMAYSSLNYLAAGSLII